MSARERVAVVTGGASGIGLATARTLSAKGCRVAIVDRDGEAAERAAAELGALGLGCDVTSTEDVGRTIAAVLERLGGIDVLVNSASWAAVGPTHELTDDVWSSLLDVHLGGTMRCSRAAFGALKEGGGAVVNLSSVIASVGVSERAAYSAAKAGVLGLTRVLAAEWAPHRIRVNAVAPGFVRTPIIEGMIARGAYSEAELVARIPLGNLAAPQDIAAGIAFLASDQAGHITGQSLTIDGGETLRPPT